MSMILGVLALTLGCWVAMEAIFYCLWLIVRVSAFLLLAVLDV